MVLIKGRQHFCIRCMSMEKRTIILTFWPQYVHDAVTCDAEQHTNIPPGYMFSYSSYVLLNLRCVPAGILLCTHCIEVQSGVTEYSHGVSSCCIFVKNAQRIWKMIKTYISCDFACTYYITDLNFVVFQRSFMDCVGMFRT
jgi:hypothetical protein